MSQSPNSSSAFSTAALSPTVTDPLGASPITTTTTTTFTDDPLGASSPVLTVAAADESNNNEADALPTTTQQPLQQQQQQHELDEQELHVNMEGSEEVLLTTTSLTTEEERQNIQDDDAMEFVEEKGDLTDDSEYSERQPVFPTISNDLSPEGSPHPLKDECVLIADTPRDGNTLSDRSITPRSTLSRIEGASIPLSETPLMPPKEEVIDDPLRSVAAAPPPITKPLPPLPAQANPVPSPQAANNLSSATTTTAAAAAAPTAATTAPLPASNDPLRSDATTNSAVVSAVALANTATVQLQQQPTQPQQAEVAFAKDAVLEFLKRTTLPTKRITDADVDHDLGGVRALIAAGSLKAALQLSLELLQKNWPPHVDLRIRLERLVALVRLGLVKNAVEELEQLGDLDNEMYRYENHAAVYPNKDGDMVPFGLRLFKAEIGIRTGKAQQALDQLHKLRIYCSKQRDHSGNNNNKNNNNNGEEDNHHIDSIGCLGLCLPHSSDPEIFESEFGVLGSNRGLNDRLWAYRERHVLLTICRHYMAKKDFPSAITVMQSLCNSAPKDVELLFALGRMHLQFGNLKGAAVTFQHAESLINDYNNDACVRLHRSFVMMGHAKFPQAIVELETALKLMPGYTPAANNLAICHLYTGQLQKAIVTLEDLVRFDPQKKLTQSVAFNLSTLYDLAGSGCLKKKKILQQLTTRCSAEDVDFSAPA